MLHDIKLATATLALALNGLAASAESAHSRPTAALAPSPFLISAEDRRLASAAVEQLNRDDKISGRVLIESVDGTLILRGDVDSPVMVYRSVEILRRLGGAAEIDASKLDG